MTWEMRHPTLHRSPDFSKRKETQGKCRGCFWKDHIVPKEGQCGDGWCEKAEKTLVGAYRHGRNGVSEQALKTWRTCADYTPVVDMLMAEAEQE